MEKMAARVPGEPRMILMDQAFPSKQTGSQHPCLEYPKQQAWQATAQAPVLAMRLVLASLLTRPKKQSWTRVQVSMRACLVCRTYRQPSNPIVGVMVGKSVFCLLNAYWVAVGVVGFGLWLQAKNTHDISI